MAVRPLVSMQVYSPLESLSRRRNQKLWERDAKGSSSIFGIYPVNNFQTSKFTDSDNHASHLLMTLDLHFEAIDKRESHLLYPESFAISSRLRVTDLCRYPWIKLDNTPWPGHGRQGCGRSRAFARGTLSTRRTSVAGLAEGHPVLPACDNDRNVTYFAPSRKVRQPHSR